MRHFTFVRAFAILTLLWAVNPSFATDTITLQPGADYSGGDYRTVKGTDLGACSSLCAGDAKCQAFTFNFKANWCFLKSDVGPLMSFRQAIAGKKGGEAATISPTLAPPLAFVDANIIQSANAYAQTLANATASQERMLPGLRAELQNQIKTRDFAKAVASAQSIITAGGKSYEDWRMLALALNAQVPDDPTVQSEFRSDSLSAAYVAYQHAVTPAQRAQSLSLLAVGLIQNNQTRQGIEAYKLAATLLPLPIMTEALQKAREKYGFRVLDLSVNADASNPQVCVQFSEDLKKGRVDYMPFITVEGKAPAAVQASDRQLCIDGIARGQRTSLTVRDGLPAENGEVTLKPTTLSVFIRERSPSVRFSGQNYVLPSAGRHGVPITSVNTSDIAVEVYYVPERSLRSVFRDGQFLTQMNLSTVRQIDESTGQKIWSGNLTAEAVPGEEVTTSFPLDEVLKNRKPGVYFMTAEPAKIRTAASQNEEDDWAPKATQWLLVSDIGLTSLSSKAELTVFVRSLNSAKAMANTEVALLARNNEVLATAKTDDMGRATFSGGVMRGRGSNAPALVTAANAEDFGFLDLTTAAFDFSDRGVSGRNAPGPVDIFMYSDRGIYRPGHTVHMTALARDDKAKALEGLPLTFIVTRPDGVEVQRYPLQEAGAGGYSLDIELKPSAMRGMWDVKAYTDPSQEAVASMSFRVDDFVPDRVEFDLTSQAKSLALDAPTEAQIDARFLYGKPASGLKIQGDLVLKPTRQLAEFPGFYFGMTEKNPTLGRTEFADLGLTDDNGKATLQIQPVDVPVTTQPLEATLNVRVVQGSGRAIERQLLLPATNKADMIGIKPMVAEFGEGQLAQFNVIAIDAAKTRIASGPLNWQLLKVRDEFQWYQRNGTYKYESVEYTDRVANGTIDVVADKPAMVEGKLDWGHYRLVVESASPTGPIANYDFYAGWYVAQTTSDTPDVLQIAMDKANYKLGETATVKIVPRFAGTVLVSVVGENLVDMKAVEVTPQETAISFEVNDKWGPGTYVTATLLKPATDESKMPSRAIGVAAVKKDETARTLGVKLDPPAQIVPRTPLLVPVSISNVPAGEQAYVTISAVDVGVLNITNFLPPDADGWFYGQRALAMELRDLYGRLIDGSLGKTGAIRVGGDSEDGAAPAGPKPEEVVALYSGIVTVAPDGQAFVTFDVPEFNGTLRLMAVAWSKTAVGDSASDVVVRDPVVISEAMPRILAPGDQTRLHLDIENTDGPEDDYQLQLVSSAGLRLGEGQKTVTLKKGKRVALDVPLAAESLGDQTVTVTLTHAQDVKVERHMGITVRASQPLVTSQKIITLQPQQSLAIDGSSFANTVSGTGKMTVAITRAGALNVAEILQSLDRYPYGCTEQTTSRALPLLYLDDVALASGLPDLTGDKQVKERVQNAIYRVLDNQSAEGSYGLWNQYSSNDVWLDAYTTDFLTRAQEKGYDVPKVAMANALANLQNKLGILQNQNDDKESTSSDLAYALYVLARNKQASIGDLRFFAETRLDTFTSPMAKAQLAAALALYGDKALAKTTMQAALKTLNTRKQENWYRSDYGSNLRDTAALIAYSAEADPASPAIAQLTKRLTALQNAQRWTSTQEDAWMLLAAQALLKSTDAPHITIGGESFAGDYIKQFSPQDLSTQPSIVNNADRPVDAVVTITAVPSMPEPAGGNGFSIERKYFKLDGSEADLRQLKQNDRMVVTLTVKQENNWPSRIMITDLLPAGLEIDNPGLVSSASLANFDWLKETPNAAYLEFRDDRFSAAMTREENDNADVTYAYVVRAVTPGSFVHPPALVEDMYRPYLNGRTDSGLLEVK